jgi:2-dehydro-3-deoxygluconokinase
MSGSIGYRRFLAGAAETYSGKKLGRDKQDLRESNRNSNEKQERIMIKLVTFGEIMVRMHMPLHLRFRQALPGNVEVTFAGAEANVAASVALLGGNAAFVTALPKHSIADACLGSLRNFNIDVSHVVNSKKGRLGIYFVEAGANQRPSNVIYDRDYSSIAEEPGTSYDWNKIFNGATWFHITGITPSLSKNAADVSLDAVKAAKKSGLTVSCDLNFRKKLWQWEPGVSANDLSNRVMRGMLPFVDLLIANEEDVQDVLGINTGAVNPDTGDIDVQKYPDVARKLKEQFPNLKKIAFTLRESISATHNNWGGMLYDAETSKVSYAPTDQGNYSPYQIRSIVDRIGGGDSFSAALIYALSDDSLKNDAAAFAAAASCLCHSIHGDFNISSKDEIIADEGKNLGQNRTIVLSCDKTKAGREGSRSLL